MGDFLARRQGAADRHDQALAQWPDRTGAAFAAELRTVVTELVALASKGADAWDGDQVEYARTLRYLGDAYFDQAQGRDAALLERGVLAYRRAEAALGSRDEIEGAKLDFNFANTLRGLSRGEDLPLLRQTKDRYLRARGVFRLKLPQLLPQVDVGLRTLDAQIALAGQYALAQSAMSELERIKAFLSDSSVPESERRTMTRPMLRAFREQYASELKLDHVRRTVDALMAELGEPAGVSEVRRQVAQLSSPLDSEPEDPQGREWMTLMLDMVVARYQADVADGRVSPVRQRAIDTQLAELRKLIEEGDAEEVPDLLEWLTKSRELMETFSEFMRGASYPGSAPKPGTRAALLETFVTDMHVFLTAEMMRPNKSAGERETLPRLFGGLAESVSQLRELGATAASFAEAERDLLRPKVRELQRFALRQHITLARPLAYGTSKLSPSGALFYSGGTGLRDLAHRVAASRDIELLTAVPGTDIAGGRFDQLLGSALALFDLTVPQGLPLAEVCYELGIARALGKTAVVVARRGEPIPFDVDLQPVFDAGGGPAETEFGNALDRAMYAVPRRQAGNSVASTVREARRLFGNEAAHVVRLLLSELESTGDDPVLTDGKLGQLLGHIGPTAPAVIYPAWPGSYPVPDASKCFHVMPFRPSWSKDAQAAVEKECKSLKVRYQRGDLAEDPQIIRAIWDDLCTSTHVVADLTGLNPNVAFELGIAHTLGRKTLIVGQRGTEASLGHGVLAKMRVSPYETGDRWKGLRQAVRQFLVSK